MTSENDDIERLLRVPSGAHRQVLGWLFIVLALAAVTVIGLRESEFLSRHTGVELVASFRQGHSLRAGSKVLLAEVQIGEVQSVKLLHDPQADTDRIHVEVRMQIKGEYKRTVPVGTVAEIRFGALEFANCVVLVPPDTPTSTMLTSGAQIATREGADMLEEARTSFAQVSRDLLAIVANIKMISDNVVDTDGDYRRIVDNMASSSSDAERILSQTRAAFESRRSVAGVLLNENGATTRQIARTLDSADRATTRIEAMADTFTLQTDTVTAIIGNAYRASALMPTVMTQADATLTAVRVLVTNVGKSWLFGGPSGAQDSPVSRTGYR
jgi:ABC-type transporter Mla subunit MlaD